MTETVQVTRNGETFEVGTKLYVGNLPYSVRSDDLKAHFAGCVSADVMMYGATRSAGCGVVEFATCQEAAKAMEELHDSEMEGRKIFVRQDKGAREKKERAPVEQGRTVTTTHDGSEITVGKRLYVGNLQYRTRWQELKDHFAEGGDVVYADVKMDRMGRSAGFGVVEYATPEEAAAAISKFNDTELGGRKIFVREDKEDRDLGGAGNRSYRPSGGARGSGGRGGGAARGRGRGGY